MTKNFKIGSTVSIVGIVALVGLYAYLNSKVGNLEREKNRLEWLLAAKEAENDTIRVIAEYTEIDTVWRTRVRTRIDTLSGKVDTVYEDIADIRGVIEIDTTKQLGPESNPMAIRVWGRFYYPEEYGHQNRLLIHPIISERPPYKPLTPRQKSWSVGLNYSRSFSQGDFLGVSVRYKRFTVAPAYDPWHKTALMTVGFDIWRF